MDNIFARYKLNDNPFNGTPSINADDIIWAGFPNIKSRITKRIQRSILVPNSTLVLNWGEYGSGKTHAARYFCKTDVLQNLSNSEKIPFALNLIFPKGKEPVKEIFTQIIDKLNISDIRAKVENNDALSQESFKNCTDNIFIQNVIRAMLTKDVVGSYVDENIFKMFLYGSIELKSFKSYGVNRKFASDNDYIEFISALFNIMTFRKILYPCVILWFDELEEISTLTMSNISNVNNFFRTMMDNSPNNLLIFLNLTQSAMMTVRDLSGYLQDAVQSRITDRIELPIPSKDDIMLYLKELLNDRKFRSEPCDENCYFPFTVDAIEEIIKDVPNVSLRKYNLIFSNLLGNAPFDDVPEIGVQYYQSKKSELPIDLR